MTAAVRANRHRRLPPYAATLVALAALVGCTGSDPGPTTTTPPATSTTAATTTAAPPTTTKPSPTATVDPVIAKIPAPARARTAVGAAAFAKFYFEQVNKGFRTGSTTELKELSVTGCVTCKAFATAIADMEAKGTRYASDLATIEYSSPLELKATNARVLVDLIQHEVPIVNAKGTRVGATPAGKASFVVSLSYTKRWVVTRVQKTEN